jgi:tetratricopeptide (TPR) repeat protein
VTKIIGIGLAVGLILTPLSSQQPAKKVKDQGEYNIYNDVLKAKDDPNKQIQLLQKWKESYPDSDYKEDRAAMVAQDYATLNKPTEAIKAAQDVLQLNPKNLTALVTIVNSARNVAPPTPDSLSAGEQAANTLLSNLDTLKPPNVSDTDWNAAKAQIAQIAQTTLGWVKMQQKQYDAAETSFRKVLQTNPKSAQAAYWLGTVLYAQKKYAPALYEFARAVSYTGEGALPDAAKQAADQYLKKAYVGYHGSEDGLDALKKQAAGAALPPDDLTIASVTDIAKGQQAAEDQFLKEHPDVKLWRELRDALKADGGETYFTEHVKDALIPPQEGEFRQFKAKVVSMENPKEIVVTVDDTDGPNGDATLVFEAPIRGKLEPGAEISFSGAPLSYSKDPFNIKFSVDRKNVTGLPAAPGPVRRTPMRKKQ